MCGIAGVVDLDGLDTDAALPRMRRALARLAPRGPDGEGIWSDGRCLLGHRRLAIVDLSDAGSQPMVREGLAITFNGMIYNYRGLRTELAAKGHSFSSDCDTEVLLAGWREWGQGLLPRLVGMFAFAIWDANAGTVVLARDAFGKKPLFYSNDRGRVVFASELRALQHLDGKRGEIDPVSLRLYLALRYVPEPDTILRGVGKVPPGCMLRISADDVEVGPWYRPESDDPAEPYTDPSAAAADLRRHIDTAVADRLVADVPVGAFLSGGIDSAIVSACMVRHAPTVRTFTIGFEGAADYYEERPAARAVADALGTDHTEITVTPDVTLDAIGPVFDGLDEPFADSSAIPTWLVSRETRRHVTVALSGDGADEVFGGYRKYQGELRAGAYHRIPRFLRGGLIEPLSNMLPESKTGRWSEKARRLRRFLAHAGRGAVDRQAGWMRTMSADEVGSLAGPGPTDDVEAVVAATRDGTDPHDPINAMLFADAGIGLPGDMLVKVDRMSMAHGLEIRCPMLDHRVVKAAFAMPGSYKLQAGRGKAVLRDAFADMLPAEVFKRPKRGFEIPIAQWLTGPLRGMAEAVVEPAGLRDLGLKATDLPARWLADLDARRRDTSEKLWTLIALQAWAAREVAEDYGGTPG